MEVGVLIMRTSLLRLATFQRAPFTYCSAVQLSSAIIGTLGERSDIATRIPASKLTIPFDKKYIDFLAVFFAQRWRCIGFCFL